MTLISTSSGNTSSDNSKSFKVLSMNKRKSADMSIHAAQPNPPPTVFKNNNRKWRWWNLLSIVVFILIVKEVFTIFSTFNILEQDHFPIRIGKKLPPEFFCDQDFNFFNSEKTIPI